jgi:hypothetical protein
LQRPRAVRGISPSVLSGMANDPVLDLLMTAGASCGKTDVMVIDTSPWPPAWRPWTVQLPAAFATAVCLFLGTIGWLAAGLLTAYNCAMTDGPPLPGCGASGWWLAAGGLAQWPLAAAVITLGIRSRDRPGFRRSAAIACWLVLPLAAGWFVLCLMAWQG